MDGGVTVFFSDGRRVPISDFLSSLSGLFDVGVLYPPFSPSFLPKSLLLFFMGPSNVMVFTSGLVTVLLPVEIHNKV